MRNTRPRAWRAIAALLALGLVAAACGDDSGGGGDEATEDTGLETGASGDTDDEEITPEYGGTITVGLEAETNTWDVDGGQFSNPGITVALSFYDPLVSLNEEGEFVPFLAESLEANEELTEWTVGLRDGVMFHDDTPLDAEALKWNFDNLHNLPDSRNKSDLTQFGVTGMEIVDDMTVKYVLSAPNAAFPDLLRGDIGWPVSPTAVQADPVDWGNNNPVGTGPFVFESWSRDNELVVVRNENYWMSDEDGNQLPYLDGITFRPIVDDSSRSASLESDDIQVMQTLRGPSVKAIQEMVDGGGFDMSTFVGNTSSISVLNTLEPPLDDLRIRQAMAMANDQEAMAEVRDDDGLVPPGTGFFSQDSPWYSADADAAYPGVDGPDPAGAKALVDEYINDPERSDGKAPGEPVTVDYQCQPDPSLQQGAQLLQQLWGQAGIEVDLGQVEQAAMITNVVGSADTDPAFAGDYSVACFRAGGGDGDPLTALQGYFGPVASTAGNFANFVDPEIDEALVTLKTTDDFAERYAAVETISRVTAENVPFIWNVATPTAVGYRDDIHGIPDWTFPDGTPGNGTPGATVRWHQVFLAQ
jgi:peptide/nickel transport system substrate-binding protein